jgi:uncharacterized protein YheU (UPF0270 family)
MASLLKIPFEGLEKETLAALIETYVLREGTDYGMQEVSLTARVEQVKRQIERGEVLIVFHQESETCTLLTDRDFRAAEAVEAASAPIESF